MEKTKKISMWERICYGFGAGGGGVIFNTLMGSFMLSYYTDTLLLNAAAVSTMFLIMRAFDGVTDVVMGMVLDKTDTKWGKARPWIFVSAICMALSVIICFWSPENLGNSAKLVYAYCSYFFASCISYTIFNIANYSLLARLTWDVDERSNISTITIIINNIVSIGCGAAIAPMVQKLGWRSTSLILGIITGVFLLLQFFFTKERVGMDETERKEEDNIPMKDAVRQIVKNKYFWMIGIYQAVLLIMNANFIQSMIYYCNWVLKKPMFISTLLSIGTIPSIIVLFFIPALSKKFSKSFVLIVSAATLILSYLICAMAGTNSTMVLIGVALKGIGISPMWSVPMAMVADVADYNEWKTGTRSVGLCSMGISVGSKIGIGLGGAVTGWILAFTNYDGTAAAQSAMAVTGIKFSFGWLNIIFAAILLLLGFAMDIEKYLPKIQKELQERKAHQEA